MYFLRLPLRSLGDKPFSTRLCSRNGFNLLSFHDADHGNGAASLLDWIDTLLKGEGVPDADGEVWLQTMPRVLGYVFNPVSFWFCHRADGALRAIVCDVRNTFGERHFYLLDTGGEIAYGSELRARKIFHVSPFFPVEGGYRFRFMRAMRRRRDDEQHLYLACVDYDDSAGPALQTSVSGTAAPLSDARVARAFFCYPLMTLGVVAMIHVHALRLWLKRVPFLSKPAPPQQEVSR